MKLQVVKSKITKRLNKSKSKIKGKNLKQKSKSKSQGSKGGLFSGKVLGFKIPVVDKVIKNKTFQKVVVGAGTVATVGALVQLVNNDQINKIWNRKEVRIVSAAATGDIVGAGAVLALEDPKILNSIRGVGQTQQGNSGQGLSNQAGFA